MAGTRWRSALLLGAGLAAGLALAEAAVRALDVPPSPLAPLHVPSYRLLDDPILRYGYRPGLAADHAAYDPMHRGLGTNALGFREGPIAVPKPPGTLRILALGDSTTAGLGIPERANTWPKLLERRLRGTGRRVEVLNLGVGGYDPEQEAELLRVQGLALEPDLVLVLLTTNDHRRGVDGGVYEALLRAREHLDVPARGVGARLLRHSRLAFVVRHRVRALVGPEAPRSCAARWSDAGAVDPLEAGLARLARISAERDLPVELFLLPALDRPARRYAHHALHERMEAVARRAGLPWTDLLAGLARIDPALRPLSLDGMHPNRRGSAAVAELVYRALRRSGRLGAEGD